jgi:hypothetical protein
MQPRRPLPLRQLLTFPILISVSNYLALALLDIALSALVPLFLAMPIEIGGLGFKPYTIGLILATYGGGSGLFQLSCFPLLVRRLGERRVFMYSLAMSLPIFALFPITSLAAKKWGISSGVWIPIACILALRAMLDTAFGASVRALLAYQNKKPYFPGAILIYITASAPKSSRGTVNGLSQTMASIARAIGPALSTSFFSFSVERNILGGYAVYTVFFVLSGCALVLARRLPEEMWDEGD